jgi:single-strand DNA-binding protein
LSKTTINRVVVVGNLTRDPELRGTAAGTSICGLRLACNARRRKPDSDEWEDRPNYFDVSVFGTYGENCARHLNKGSRIAVDGRLEWSEWETADGHHREAVQIVADSVQFLGARQGASGEANGSVPVAVGADGDGAEGELEF